MLIVVLLKQRLTLKIDGFQLVERHVLYRKDRTGNFIFLKNKHIEIRIIVENQSSGYNIWRDTKKPSQILTELCESMNINLPVYTEDHCSLAIGEHRFDCDPQCLRFLKTTNANDLSCRKGLHESPEEYLKQNTALQALLQWGEKINSVILFFFIFFLVSF